jgi:coproporphyrinogen III oxidase-like Fe-S oxidoreductase
LISNIAGYITRREGKKFLKLQETPDESRICSRLLRPGEELSLYIHIPFCRKLCPFCCFNRYLFREDQARKYYVSLKKELDIYIQRGFVFSDFYFGGGTPTIMMDELISFINYLKKNFPVKAISLETTPNELTPEKIATLKHVGVNRLSLGVQSFDDDMLESMGRTICMGSEAKKKILLAQGQFATINIDMIFNFPFQTLEKFNSDIDDFKKLGIDQVTFYPLMPSPHKKNAMERKFAKVNNSREKQYYDVILRKILDQDYQPSTVWCFSMGSLMIDEYIVDYADYIGIGSGSVSLVNGIFYVNSFSLEKYNALLENNRLPIVRWRNLSEQEYFRYYLLTKLFGTRIDKNDFRQQFGTDIHAVLNSEINLLKIAGAVTENNNEILVTRGGMHTISVMMREFFAALNTLREYCIENQI